MSKSSKWSFGSPKSESGQQSNAFRKIGKRVPGAVLGKISAQDASELRIRQMSKRWKANLETYVLTKYEPILVQMGVSRPTKVVPTLFPARIHVSNPWDGLYTASPPSTQGGLIQWWGKGGGRPTHRVPALSHMLNSL